MLLDVYVKQHMDAYEMDPGVSRKHVITASYPALCGWILHCPICRKKVLAFGGRHWSSQCEHVRKIDYEQRNDGVPVAIFEEQV